MKKVVSRRPSASMIVAIVALVMAATGTAYAAHKLTSGDKLIKKGTLSGNRLRKHTITGTQVNLGKLGKVPSAKHADTAGSATNASRVGGVPASSFLTAANRISTPGIVKTTGSAAGTTVTLFTSGPFKVTLICRKSGGDTSLQIDGQSSEAGSVMFDHQVAANRPTDLTSVLDINPRSTFGSQNDTSLDFEAPSGARAEVIGADGVNSLGTDCWATFAGIN